MIHETRNATYTLRDDGTLDTVIGVYCSHCGRDHELNFSTDYASSYRNKETGELNFIKFCDEVIEPDECDYCGV